MKKEGQSDELASLEEWFKEYQCRLTEIIDKCGADIGHLDFVLEPVGSITLLTLASNQHERNFFAEISKRSDFKCNEKNKTSFDLIVDNTEDPMTLTAELLSHLKKSYPNATGIPINLYLSLDAYLQTSSHVAVSSSGKLLLSSKTA